MATSRLRSRAELVAYFWSKVRKGEGCWEWMGTRSDGGYGVFGYNYRQVIAHRFAWELQAGPVPPQMGVLHRCDNRGCVRFDHFFLGTNTENMADRTAKGRSAVGERNGGGGKLNAAQVIEIRRRADGGESATVIARAFGISGTMVNYIAKRKQWAHL